MNARTRSNKNALTNALTHARTYERANTPVRRTFSKVAAHFLVFQMLHCCKLLDYGLAFVPSWLCVRALVCVCVCAFMPPRVCAFMRPCAVCAVERARACAFVQLCIRACMCAFVRACARACTRACICAFVHARSCTRVVVRAFVRVCAFPSFTTTIPRSRTRAANLLKPSFIYQHNQDSGNKN